MSMETSSGLAEKVVLRPNVQAGPGFVNLCLAILWVTLIPQSTKEMCFEIHTADILIPHIMS